MLQLNVLFDEDMNKLRFALRKTSEEVLFAEETTRAAGFSLVKILELINTMLKTEKWFDKGAVYDQIRELAQTALTTLSIADDHVFPENERFLPTIVKHLRYIVAFKDYASGHDQGFGAFDHQLNTETSVIVQQLANEYRRLLHQPMLPVV